MRRVGVQGVICLCLGRTVYVEGKGYKLIFHFSVWGGWLMLKEGGGGGGIFEEDGC